MAKKKKKDNSKTAGKSINQKAGSKGAGKSPAQKNSRDMRAASNSGWFSKFNTTEDAIPLTDYASYMPGFMMIIMIALILVLDLFTTTMADSQYYAFHNVFRVFDYIIRAVGIMFLTRAAIRKEIRICLRDWFFIGFMVCIIISTCINGISHEAAFGIPIRYLGIFNMFAFFIIYMKVSGYIERIEFRYRIRIGYMLVADAITLAALYDKYIGQIEAFEEKIGISALFANSNHYGYFICMAIMIGIGFFVYETGWKMITGAVTALLNLLMLVLNNTLGAEMAIGVCVVVMIIVILLCDRADKVRVKKVLGMAAFFAVCVAGVLVVSQDVRDTVVQMFADMARILSGKSDGTEGSGRLLQWQTTISYIKEKPLFGFGCEGITMRLQDATGVGDAHCEPMTYAAYYGIPAMLLYLGGIVAAAVSYFKNRASLPSYCRIAFLAASAYFLSSLVGVLMFYTAPFFFVFMGMSAEEYNRN